MANGRPGDTPLTDLLVHGIRLYSDETDALIRDIVYLGARDRLEREFHLDWTQPPPAVVEQLRLFRRQLIGEARERGWELPPGRFDD